MQALQRHRSMQVHACALVAAAADTVECKPSAREPPASELGSAPAGPPPLPLHEPLLDKPNCEYWIRLGSFINQSAHSTTHLHASGLGRQRAVHHARPVLRLALDELQSMDRVVAKSAARSWNEGHPPWKPCTPRLFTRLIHPKLPSPSHTALTRKLDGVDALAGARQHAVSQKPAVPPTYKHTLPLRTCLMA